MNKKNQVKIIKYIVLVLVVFLIFYEGQKEIKSIDFAKTILLIRSFKISTIISFFIFGLASILVMTLYDFIIVNHLKLDINKLKVFEVSFIANTTNNVSGLGGLTGASIRALLFKKSTDGEREIINYSLLLLPATGVGLSVFSLISIFNFEQIAPIMEHYKWLYVINGAFIFYLIGYFFIDIIYYHFKKEKYNGFEKHKLAVKTELLGASLLEWLAAFLFFSYIIKQFDSSINLYNVLGIFTLASVAGIASMLPGGAGSFDLIVLLGLKNSGMSLENNLAVVILYRTFYLFIPLIIGIVMTLLLQLRSTNNLMKSADLSKIKSVINKTSNFTNMLLRTLVFLSGIVLLVSALVPGVASRLKIASELLSFPIMQWSHQLSICIGILLVSISREIGMKVKRAYKITLFLLISGSIFTFFKGFDYEEAIFLGIVFTLLYLSKGSFFRKSLPFNWLATALNLFFGLIAMIIYARLKHLILMDFLKIFNVSVLLKNSTLYSNYNGIIAYFSLIIFIVTWQFTKPRIETEKRFEKVDESKLKEFLEKNSGHYLTHLVFLEDKNIFWAASNQVAIVYQKSHNIFVVLGDPIGNEKYFNDALAEFQDFIDEYGYKAAFYEVGESLLPMYHDYGYNFFKLGETAVVNLQDFDLTGSKFRDFRNVMSRFQRDGYSFELYELLTDELYDDLKAISDEWLSGRKEMGFSLGSFSKKYLSHSPVAILKHKESNEIIAFATIMPSYDKNESVSLDLMRFKKQSPNNTMTFLILNLILRYKEKGYHYFNIGMAPLSNVGRTQRAHFTEKLANSFTHYGNHFYSFKGLRSYKEKFYPDWEPRYLAYEDITLLPSSLIEAAILIHTNTDE